MERVTGIEPASAAWEAAILPMNYTRILRSNHFTIQRFSLYVTSDAKGYYTNTFTDVRQPQSNTSTLLEHGDYLPPEEDPAS